MRLLLKGLDPLGALKQRKQAAISVTSTSTQVVKDELPHLTKALNILNFHSKATGAFNLNFNPQFNPPKSSNPSMPKSNKPKQGKQNKLQDSVRSTCPKGDAKCSGKVTFPKGDQPQSTTFAKFDSPQASGHQDVPITVDNRPKNSYTTPNPTYFFDHEDYN